MGWKGTPAGQLLPKVYTGPRWGIVRGFSFTLTCDSPVGKEYTFDQRALTLESGK